MQFYVGDWRKDPGVQALNFHDRGVWFEILCIMHESEERGKLMLNGAIMPHDALARLLGLDKQILTTTLTTLLTYGVCSRCDETGAIICRRMIRDENLRKIRAECGKQGGNPNLVNQKSTTMVNQKSTPSSSLSISTSISDNIPTPTIKKKESVCVIESPFADLPKETKSTMDELMAKINGLKPSWQKLARWTRNEMEALRGGVASQMETLTDDDWQLLKDFLNSTQAGYFRPDQRAKLCESFSGIWSTCERWKTETKYKTNNGTKSLFY